MTTFQDTWNKAPKPGISEQLHGMVKKEAPLKPRVQQSVKKLDGSISKLDYMSQKLAEKDAKLFQRIIQAYKNHDIRTGKILANELAELRKNERVLGNLKLSLDQVQLRLSTVSELGDAVVALGPAVSTMRALGPALGKFLPQAGSEFEAMSNVLGGMMVDSFGGSFEVDGGSSEESESILREAAAVATNQIGDKFPSVPSPVYDGSQSRVDGF
jgi:division protein CdvB (Snf7/Vps24/ESCRT-III family)